MPRLLPLLEAVAGDPAILDVQRPPLGPFAVLGEADVSHHGAELVRMDVLGDLRLVDLADPLHRLADDLHHRVRVGRQEEPERIELLRGRERLVAGKELLHSGELDGRLGRVDLPGDHAVEQGSELGLEVRVLHSDHGAAELAGLERDLVRSPDHSCRIRRVGGHEDHVRVGRLDGADDGSEVGRRRRVRLVVDHLQPGGLHVGARAFEGGVRVLRVGAHQRHGGGLWIHGHRDFEEALGEADRRIGAVGHDLEVAVVLEPAVRVGAEQRHEGHLALHGDGDGRRDHVGAVARDDEVDFVDVEQLVVEARHVGRVRLVVVVDELHRPAEQAALGVHVLGPHLHREQRGPAVPAERAGEAHAEPDLERFLGGGGKRGGEDERSDARVRAFHGVPPPTTRRGFVP